MRFLLASKFIATIMLALITAIAGLVFSTTARAQDIVGGASRTNLSGPSRASTGSAPRRPQTKYVTKTNTVTYTRTVVREANTGSIVVSAEPGASVVVEPMRGGTGSDLTVPPGVDQVAFNKLTPGRYRVAASLEGYEDSEREVTVSRGVPATVSMSMQPKLFTVTIETNVPSGNIIYAPVIAAGIDPATGKTRYNRAPGDARVTPITNGRAVLANLRQGDYGLDIHPADPSYEQLNASISLPSPTSTIPVTLSNIESKGTFAATWTNLEAWNAPGGWRIQDRKLFVNGRGIALPREVLNRNFKDFQMVSDVKMVNGVAATFIVHAQNESNYYLIQLTGPNADEPYVLRGFLVRNGMPQRIGASIPLDAFTQTLKPNQFFTVTMNGVGNSFKVSLTDSQTGDVLPLGILTDPAANFRIGAVGIGARDNEQNEVGRFIVCAGECRGI